MEIIVRSKNGTPESPYCTTSPKLALKRFIKLAQEEGIDFEYASLEGEPEEQLVEDLIFETEEQLSMSGIEITWFTNLKIHMEDATVQEQVNV